MNQTMRSSSNSAPSSASTAGCALTFVAMVVAMGATLVGGPLRAMAQPAPPVPAAGGGDGTDDAPVHMCAKARGPVTVSFKPDTELKDLISWAMTFTCKNFMHDSTINTRAKKVTVISPNKMSPTEAYRLFLAALSSMGLTVVPKGNVLKIVESGTAKGETLPLRKGGVANDDSMVRFVMRPSFMSAAQLNEALGMVRSKDGTSSVVGAALVITDYGSHVRDMINLARELDRPSANEGIYTIPVEHADAKDLATKLSEVLGIGQGGGGGGSGDVKGGKGTGEVSAALPSKILTDERSNTLIVLATEPGYLRVRALVKRLDMALPTGDGGSIHVYPLANAKAEELATTLNAALQGGGRQQQGRPSEQRVPNRGAANVISPDLGSALEGEVKITHDAPTNSLVVVGTGRDFLAVKEVIRKLDITPRQVYLEVVILEVSVNTGRQLGSSSHGGYQTPGSQDSPLFLGGVQAPELKSTNLATLLGANGLIGGIIGPPLPGAERILGATGVTFPSYAVLFQALASTNVTNVVQTPSFVATDNKESVFEVGTNIPFLSQTSPAIIPGQPQLSVGQSVQRKPLVLSLKITPHINDSGMIRLDLEQQMEDVGPEAAGGLGPTWTERKVKTQMVVRDQQTMIVGGLMQDKMKYEEIKVPLLGDIPILGYLFKHTNATKEKANLLILLTPYLVRDSLDMQEIVERNTRHRNEYLRAYSNIDLAKYLPRIDYRRKRGLLEEINRTVEGVEREAKMLESMGNELQRPEGLIEYKDDNSGLGTVDPPGASADKPDGSAPEGLEIDPMPKESDTPSKSKPKTPSKPSKPGKPSAPIKSDASGKLEGDEPGKKDEAGESEKAKAKPAGTKAPSDSKAGKTPAGPAGKAAPADKAGKAGKAAIAKPATPRVAAEGRVP